MEGLRNTGSVFNSAGESHVAIDRDGLFIFDVFQILGQDEHTLAAVPAERQPLVNCENPVAAVYLRLVEIRLAQVVK